MPSITDYYGIPGPVPFIDVELSADNLLFLDPHAIRLSTGPEPYAEQALHCIDTFAATVLRCVIDGTPASHRKGRLLLQRFSEPWETRCGMAAKGYRGHGGADVIGDRIFTALTDDLTALIEVNLLGRLEELPLFVPGVDRDITSDITTRITFGILAQFTAAMLATYPQFSSNGHQTVTCPHQVWNPRTCDWSETEIELPAPEGKPLLLVPQEWARRHLLMSARRYYETSALSFAQIKQAVRAPDGSLIKMSKDQLRKLSGLNRGRETNLRLTLEALADGEDLLRTFWSFVALRRDDGAQGQSPAA